MTDTGYNINNGNYSTTSLDINKVIPQSEIQSKILTGNTNAVTHQMVTLSNNYTNTTNYAVFPTVYYGYSGSGGTYDAIDTSSAVHPIIIEDISASEFYWSLGKHTGDNVNITIVFLIVYNLDNLNYAK